MGKNLEINKAIHNAIIAPKQDILDFVAICCCINMLTSVFSAVALCMGSYLDG